eukprot:10765689-Alexandrium_andersonii.AAC.1
MHKRKDLRLVDKDSWLTWRRRLGATSGRTPATAGRAVSHSSTAVSRLSRDTVSYTHLRAHETSAHL